MDPLYMTMQFLIISVIHYTIQTRFVGSCKHQNLPEITVIIYP